MGAAAASPPPEGAPCSQALGESPAELLVGPSSDDARAMDRLRGRTAQGREVVGELWGGLQAFRRRDCLLGKHGEGDAPPLL